MDAYQAVADAHADRPNPTVAIDYPELPSGSLRLAAWHADRGTWWALLAEERHATNVVGGARFIPTITDPACSLAQAHAALASAYAAIDAQRNGVPQ